jgi:hypothetical protein
MKKYFTKKGNAWLQYTSLKDEEGNDRLDQLVKQLEKEAEVREKEEEDDDDEEEDINDMFNQKFPDEEEKIVRKRKSKYLAPEWFIIFDDLSNELKSKSLLTLLTKNRHFKCKICISSQYLNHLLPESRKQIDVWIIFKGHPEDKLQTIFNDADLAIDFNMFKQIYYKATEKKYSFLYVDTRNDQFRRNFNSKFTLPK